MSLNIKSPEAHKLASYLRTKLVRRLPPPSPLLSANASRPSVAAANANRCLPTSEPLALSPPRFLESLLRRASISIESVTVEQALPAREAYSDYGKGRHPAGLNFGDCFSYALAKATGEPLLFIGDDFRKTDVIPALP
jgi:ribonuclease VapC